MPIVDDKLKIVPNAATFEGIVNALYSHSSTGTKFFKDNLTWDTVPKQFQSVVTVAKTGHGDFVCSDVAYESDDQCIQAALTYIQNRNGGVICFNEGHYMCSTYLSYSGDNLTLVGQGNAILDFSSITASASCISIRGSISTTNSALSENVSAGSLTVTVADGSIFAVSEWIRIRSNAIFQPRLESNPWNQYVGEIQKIKSISGNVLTLCERLHGNYNIEDLATADKVNMHQNITIKNIKFIGNSTISMYAINISQCFSVTIENITSEDMYDRCANLVDCINVQYNKNTIWRSNKPGLGYGIALLNACRNVTIFENKFYDCRHGITWGGGNSYGVQYNIICVGNTQSYDSQEIGMFGPHPSANGVIIAYNTCIGCGLGFINCINAVVSGNVVQKTDGTYAAFAVGGASENILISDNAITSPVTCIKVYTEYPGIQIVNNRLTCTSTSGDASGINVVNQITDIKIDTNTISTINPGIYFTNSAGLRDSDNISIRNNTLTCTSGLACILLDGYTYNYNKVNIIDNILTGLQNTVPGIRLKKQDGTHGVNTYVVIDGNICYNATTGINISYSSNVEIEHNKVHNATTGIVVGTGSADYSISYNILKSCTTAISDTVNEATRTIHDNIGYKTENAGSTTIPTSQTSVTVTHGLAATPTKFSVTPFGNVGNCWITNAGATTFKINVSSAPASNTLISWSASV